MRRLTFANVVATVAVFLALSGVGFAATRIPHGSVGATQLKAAAVTPAKLARGALAQRVAGPRGAAGAVGATGATGKTAEVQALLPAGATETGVFAYGAGSSAARTFLSATARFIRPLPFPLGRGQVELIAVGESPRPGCPGIGRAEPGFFCAYTYEESNAEPATEPENPSSGSDGAGTRGAQFFFAAKNPLEASYVYGSWAVTAP